MARVADAEVGDLVAPEQVYVQPVPFAPQHGHAGDGNRAAEAEQLGIDGVEAGEHSGLGDGEFFGVDHALQQGGQAAEEHAEYHADKNHARQITPALPQQQAEQQQRAAEHGSQFQREFAV